MRLNIKNCAIALTILLSAAMPAHSALITDLSSGGNNTVIDNSTGFTWLALSETVEFSVQDILDNPITSFNVATETQVIQLFSGLLDSDLSAFHSLFGETDLTAGGTPDDVFGLYTAADGSSVNAAGGSFDSENLFFNILGTNLLGSSSSLDASFDNAGVFLVNTQVVSSPSVLALFGISLICIAFKRRQANLFVT